MDALQQVFAAFSEEQVARLTGVSLPQLRYWAREGFYRPTYEERNRRLAYSRIYSFKDVVALRVLNTLRNKCGITLQHLRLVSEKLGKLNENPDKWIFTKLYPLNGRVVWFEQGAGVPADVASGQIVAAVVLDDVVQQVKADVRELRAPRDAANFGKISKSRFIQHNSAVVSGTRIPVAAIKRFSEAGYSPKEILNEYPDLSMADIDAALEYKEKGAA